MPGRCRPPVHSVASSQPDPSFNLPAVLTADYADLRGLFRASESGLGFRDKNLRQSAKSVVKKIRNANGWDGRPGRARKLWAGCPHPAESLRGVKAPRPQFGPFEPDRGHGFM